MTSSVRQLVALREAIAEMETMQAMRRARDTHLPLPPPPTVSPSPSPPQPRPPRLMTPRQPTRWWRWWWRR